MRTNRHGDPCPEWCTQDHDGEYPLDHHHGEVTRTKLSGSPGLRATERLFGPIPGRRDRYAVAGVMMFDRDACQREDGDPPLRVDVQVVNEMVPGACARLWMEPREATQVAELLELLAYATPTQVFRLAEGIRDAIKIAAPEGEGKAAQ